MSELDLDRIKDKLEKEDLDAIEQTHKIIP